MTYTVALCQMPVVEDKEKNIETALRFIREAALKADIIVLPEMWSCPYEAVNFPVYAEPADGPVNRAMAKAAKEVGKTIIAGSVPESSGGAVYNTSYVYSADGAIIAKHRKAHLFDIDVAGGIRFFESDTLTAGDSATVFTTPFGKIGLGICYDIRFFHLADTMAQAGADILAYPACFNMTTGPAHWHLALRSRAVDNQVYTLAVCTARSEELSYTAYGHSLCCDPWGTIICEAGTGPEIVYAEIDTERLAAVRRQLPLKKQRRQDLGLVTT